MRYEGVICGDGAWAVPFPETGSEQETPSHAMFIWRLGKERDALQAKLSAAEAEIALRRKETETIEYSLAHRLGGMVEGRPTGAHNYLQRVHELLAAEARLASAEGRAEAAESVMTAAALYIEESPCDPDITVNQYAAWDFYKKACEKYQRWHDAASAQGRAGESEGGEGT